MKLPVQFDQNQCMYVHAFLATLRDTKGKSNLRDVVILSICQIRLMGMVRSYNSSSFGTDSLLLLPVFLVPVLLLVVVDVTLGAPFLLSNGHLSTLQCWCMPHSKQALTRQSEYRRPE